MDIIDLNPRQKLKYKSKGGSGSILNLSKNVIKIAIEEINGEFHLSFNNNDVYTQIWVTDYELQEVEF